MTDATWLVIEACWIAWLIYWVLRQEEQIMSSHFPDAYAEYKIRVHAIIPFLL